MKVYQSVYDFDVINVHFSQCDRPFSKTNFNSNWSEIFYGNNSSCRVNNFKIAPGFSLSAYTGG